LVSKKVPSFFHRKIGFVTK